MPTWRFFPFDPIMNDMNREIYKTLRSRIVRGLGIVGVLLLSSCGENLVFSNEFDPEADNSPLGIPITGVYAYGFVDGFGANTVDLGWDRVDNALSYDYEVVQVYGDETAEQAFAEADNGTRGLSLSNTVAQPADPLTMPTDQQPADDGTYAMRVRYYATASNAGVTAQAASPWSTPFRQELGVDIYSCGTWGIGTGEWFSAGFQFRGDKRIFDFTGTGGTVVTLQMRDEWSGYPDGADPIIAIYDATRTFDGPFYFEYASYDKTVSPISFSMPANGWVFIVVESDNPDTTFFEIRLD